MSRLIFIAIFAVMQVSAFADSYTWTNTASPWTITTNLPVGQWTVWCEVKTSDGTNAVSGTNTFTVGIRPTVTITYPTTGLSLPVASISFAASPVAGSGTITNLTWSIDSVTAWTNTATPWGFTSSPAAGSHTVMALVTDNIGFTASNSVSFITYTTITNAVRFRNRWKHN